MPEGARLGRRDVHAVALAVAVWIGAVVGWAVPRAPGAALLGAGVLGRRWWLVLLGALALASGVGAAAERGLAPVGEADVTREEVALVGDPVAIGGRGVRVDVAHRGVRLEAVAFGAAAAALGPRAAGQRVTVTGRRSPRPAATPWLEVRHVRGRLQVETVHRWRRGSLASRVANGARAVLARGAEPLPARLRPLYLGMLVGDDRDQHPRTVDDLRAAGLGHLLAVSGQNVAFVLALVGPILRRLPPPARLAVTLVVLGLFVSITRAEPSVLRASAMAGGAAVAVAAGREAAGLRALAYTVAALVLIDPLLVRSLAFQLSVAATAGIVTTARPIASRLPGPRRLAEVAGLTIAAQAAVSPLLVTIFGGVPVAAVPANLLAAPAAAPVMMWGLTGGFVAGLVASPVAGVLQLPTRVATGWVAAVGSGAGRLPLGEMQGGQLIALVVIGAVWWGARNRARSRAVRALALVACGAVALWPAVAMTAATQHGRAVAPGVELWHDREATVAVLGSDARPVAALAALRRAGVARLDLVVITADAGTGAGGAGAAGIADVLASRYPTGRRWDLSSPAVGGSATADRPEPGTVVWIGDTEVRVLAGPAGPEVSVRRGVRGR